MADILISCSKVTPCIEYDETLSCHETKTIIMSVNDAEKCLNHDTLMPATNENSADSLPKLSSSNSSDAQRNIKNVARCDEGKSPVTPTFEDDDENCRNEVLPNDLEESSNERLSINEADNSEEKIFGSAILLQSTNVPFKSISDENRSDGSMTEISWCQNDRDLTDSNMSSGCNLETPSTSGQRSSKISTSKINALENNIQDLTLSGLHYNSNSLPMLSVNSGSCEISVVDNVAYGDNSRVSGILSGNSPTSIISNQSEDDNESNDSLDQLDLTASLNFSKLLIKRKPDSKLDSKLVSSKKQCTDKQQWNHLSDMSTPLTSGASTTISARKRIPSKENPPPELSSWLNTFQMWSNAERMMALDQLIDQCEPTQVRHIMSVIEPQFQRDFISLLPKELALYVLSFLEPKDLLRAAQTCRYWRILAEDNLLWREKCRESGINEVKEVLGKRRAKSISVLPSPWKSAFMRQHNIEMNWRFRPIRTPKALKGHDDHVITCLQFSASRIVSGSDDNTLKVWSAMTGKCLRTLVGHTGGVWSSQMAGNVIVSGSTDRNLKVWNSETGQCIHTLYGHTSTVRCMNLHENKVVSGSRDATLRVWDIDSGECLHVLIGHVAAVRCVQYDGRLVVSGAYDYMVKVWNPDNEECLHTLQGHTNRVYSLQFDGIHVVSGSLDTSIRVWDVETGSCKHTLMGHQSLTSGMELKNNILVSGNADSTVKVWDITTGQCLQTLSGPNKHHSAVTCLQFNSTFVITSSDDGTVKLWDLKTGEFVRNLVALDSGGSGGVVWRIRSSHTKLVCAVGSRNGTEETKLLVLDFDVESKS